MDGFYGDVIVLAASLLKGTVTGLLVSSPCLPADQDILCVQFLMHVVLISTQEVLVAWTDPSLLGRLLDPTDLALCPRKQNSSVPASSWMHSGRTRGIAPPRIHVTGCGSD